MLFVIVKDGGELTDTFLNALLPSGMGGGQNLQEKDYDVMPFQNLFSDNGSVEYVR